MSKVDTQSLESVIKKINKNIVASFVIILLFFIFTISLVFVGYKNNEKKTISQKLNATFLAFADKISEKLIVTNVTSDFRDYLRSGWVSREKHYPEVLGIISKTGLLDITAGIEIFDNKKMSVFFNGIRTEDSVTLGLCYYRWYLNFDIGNCSHQLRLYFKHDDLVKELKKINPELVDCNNCGKAITIGKYFGDFPIREFSGMKINLDIKKSPTTILWEMVVSIVGLLLILVTWNVNRIKKIFKRYLSEPIVEITSKIKEDKSLPRVEVEELSYLTKQVDQWKSKIIELEKKEAKEKAREARIKTMQSIGASIAHELRTPIRSIISGVAGIEKFLPILLKGYGLAKNANLLTETIRPHQVELLHKVLVNLKTEGTAANTIIDMLLMKIKGNVTEATELKRLSINDCLQEALERYVFQESERELIICDTKNDFEFVGDKLLIVHIIFNLLKNALYYIASVQRGQIYIHFEKGKDENRLHFKDTGKGISKEILPRIFNRFYSKTKGGVGIGLSFCKMAMEWMGGDITCKSIEDEYAEFILHFPVPKK